LSLEIHLDERHDDRVYVSVLLKPDGGDVQTIHGVELELQCPKRMGLSPRVLLPISGELSGAIMTQAEIRSSICIPQGARVVGTVWTGNEQLVAECPTDPSTGMEGHVRGHPRIGTQVDDRALEDLLDSERLVLRRALPWLGMPATEEKDHNLDVTDDEVDDLCGHLGLDDECTQWLKDLMAEDA